MNTFPLWVIAASVTAYLVPSLADWLAPYISVLLSFIMCGMGMTLQVSDFKRVLVKPKPVLCGFLGQFLIMPLLGWILVHVFPMSNDLAVGVILTATAPGGTASNVIALLAGGDVPLSVTMTACSTLAAVFLTPALTWLLAGAYVPVNAGVLFLSVVKIVLLPVAAGLILHVYAPKWVARFSPYLPTFSAVIITAVIASIVATSREQLPQAISGAGVVVFLHNGLGFLFGYSFAMLWKLPEQARRTIAIEVGMQNSGLAMALAKEHFTALAAVPPAIFSVIHNLNGSILAAYFRRYPSTS